MKVILIILGLAIVFAYPDFFLFLTLCFLAYHILRALYSHHKDKKLRLIQQQIDIEARLTRDRFREATQRRLEEEQSRRDRFRATSDFDLVARYVERTSSDSCGESDIRMLWELIPSHWNLSENDLKMLVNEERVRQENDTIKSRILMSSAGTRDGLCLAYLELYWRSRYEHLDVLWEVLCESGHCKDITFSDLTAVLERVEHQAELNAFRNALMSDSRSVVFPDLDNLDGPEFETLVATLYSKMGYETEITPASGDHGADVIAQKLGTCLAIQAKCWSGSVGNSAVQEIAAAARHYGATDAVVVTTSYFTSGAKALAKSNDVELVDREGLQELMRRYWK